MGGAAGRPGMMPGTSQGMQNGQGAPLQGQMPQGLQDVVSRIQAMPQFGNLPQQSMIQRYLLGQSAPASQSGYQQPSIPQGGFVQGYPQGGLPQGGYAMPRPVQAYQPQVTRPMPAPTAPVSPQAPTFTDADRAELDYLRARQNGNANGDWSAK